MLDELLAIATNAAWRSGEILVDSFEASDVVAEEKGRNDLVSRVDRASEAALLDEILTAFPSHRVLAEEGGVHEGASAAEIEWIVDPLDGTRNYLQGLPCFCVSVACRRGAERLVGVVLDPLRRDLFTAVAGRGASRNGVAIHTSGRRDLDGAFLATGFPFKAHPALDLYLGIFGDLFLHAGGVRRCGAAALDLAYTAAGVYDGFFEFRLAPWDLAAGSLLIEEAGGVVTDLDGGGSYLESGNLVAGPPAVHRAMLDIVQRHASEAELDRRVSRSAR